MSFRRLLFVGPLDRRVGRPFLFSSFFLFSDFVRNQKRDINIKNLGRNPPPSQTPPPKRPLTWQILYVWGLFSLQNTGKRPTSRISRGRGGLGGPKILYAEFLRVLFLHLILGPEGPKSEKPVARRGVICSVRVRRDPLGTLVYPFPCLVLNLGK